MKHIITFAGSNSKKSINKELAVYASGLIDDVEVTVLDLNDFDLPIYGIDNEIEYGIPDDAKTFMDHIEASDGIIISFAEHNGSYAVAFKNVMDWMSRLEGKLWRNKPMLLLATSPGGRGGMSVLDTATKSFPHMGAQVIANFSLPSFHQNFSEGKIINEELNEQLKSQVVIFKSKL